MVLCGRGVPGSRFPLDDELEAARAELVRAYDRMRAAVLRAYNRDYTPARISELTGLGLMSVVEVVRERAPLPPSNPLDGQV